MKALDFPVAATVETDLTDHDVAFAYAASGQLQARWCRSVRMRDERVLWLFEHEEDAVQFICRIGGEPRGLISVSQWQAARLP